MLHIQIKRLRESVERMEAALKADNKPFLRDEAIFAEQIAAAILKEINK